MLIANRAWCTCQRSRQTRTRHERRRASQRASDTMRVHPGSTSRARVCDDSPMMVARGLRPAWGNVQLCGSEWDHAKMAPNDVPGFLRHGEVLDPGCGAHIANEAGFFRYEDGPAEDRKCGRGSRIAGGKFIPTKGEALRRFEVDGINGHVHVVTGRPPSRRPSGRNAPLHPARKGQLIVTSFSRPHARRSRQECKSRCMVGQLPASPVS